MLSLAHVSETSGPRFWHPSICYSSPAGCTAILDWASLGHTMIHSQTGLNTKAEALVVPLRKRPRAQMDNHAYYRSVRAGIARLGYQSRAKTFSRSLSRVLVSQFTLFITHTSTEPLSPPLGHPRPQLQSWACDAKVRNRRARLRFRGAL